VLGRARRGALLVDFFEHEVLEPTLFGHDRIPGHVLDLAHDGLAVEVGELDAIGSDDGEIAIGQEEQVAGVIENGGHIGGDKIFVFSEADHGGRAIASGDNLVRFLDRYHRNRKDARQFL
jgi:hypothetical protein